MSRSLARAMTRGVVFVHSTPAALCPHIIWALESALGHRVAAEWIRQPLGAKLLRTEVTWEGEAGAGGRVASALRACEMPRFEVTEEPSTGNDGSRWSYTPSLGMHHSWTSAAGDMVINEDRLRSAIAASKGDVTILTHELDRLLGAAWDHELEPFRQAGEGTTVRWLHMVG